MSWSGRLPPPAQVRGTCLAPPQLSTLQAAGLRAHPCLPHPALPFLSDSCSSDTRTCRLPHPPASGPGPAHLRLRGNRTWRLHKAQDNAAFSEGPNPCPSLLPSSQEGRAAWPCQHHGRSAPGATKSREDQSPSPLKPARQMVAPGCGAGRFCAKRSCFKIKI